MRATLSRAGAAIVAMTASAAAAGPAPVALCGKPVTPGTDGRLMNHIPYPEAPAAALVATPPGFGTKACLLRREVVDAIGKLLAAAKADGLSGQIRGVSCFRSVNTQLGVFCGGVKGGDLPARARWSAPPGYSEHATGYTLDFGLGPLGGGCANYLNPCVAGTRAGQWMLANARRFGFELSFPNGNKQGVGYEPWHWRWVGAAKAGERLPPAAITARKLFARARVAFPASPAIPDER